jgi:hypothetical protein
VRITLEPGTRARSFDLSVIASTGEPGTLWIRDVRVMGQTERLERYVAARLRPGRAIGP